MFHHKIRHAFERKISATYLLMSKSELVLQNGFPVAQKLHFVCEDIKIFCQCSREFLIVEVIIWHIVETKGSGRASAFRRGLMKEDLSASPELDE
jgi:hypothetical protein